MKKRPLCLVCIGLMIVIWMMKQAGVPIFGEPALPSELKEELQSGKEVHITGTILGRNQKPDSTQYILKDTFLIDQTVKIPIYKILLTVRETELFSVGDRIEVFGILSAFRPPGNPGEFDVRAYYACQSIYYSLWGEQICLQQKANFSLREMLLSFREDVTERLQSLDFPEISGILSAMVFGEREYLSQESRRNYQMVGISHVLSISGLHITLLGMGLLRLLLFLRLPDKGAAAAAAAGMALYCLMTGGQPSALRAFLMFGVMLGARLQGRSYDLMCSLSLAGILMLLERPGYLFSSGFQLSFAAVVGAGAAASVYQNFLSGQNSRRKRRKCRMAEKAVRAGITWAAVNLCTLPLICYYFYEIPVYSLFANLLLVPLTGVVLISGLAGSMAALASRLLGKILLMPAVFCLNGFEAVTEMIRRLPGAVWVCGQPRIWQIMLYYAGLGTVIWMMKRQSDRCPDKQQSRLPDGHPGKKPEKKKYSVWKRMAVILGISCGILLWRKTPGISVTALDVGQGDCLAVTAGRGFCYLVDGGSSDVNQVGKYRILPYLKQQGIRTLEGIFITHPDQDHMNGIYELLKAAAEQETAPVVKRLYLPCWMEAEEEGRELALLSAQAGIPVVYLQKGNVIRAGDLRIQVLHPEKEDGFTGNEGSMVLLLSCGAFDGLLTGDLEGMGEEAVTEQLKNCEFLKVAHHGSRNSTSESFLACVSPRVCVISAPQKSIYGHPHREVLKRIEATGADWYQTGKSGAVRLTVTGNEMKVQEYRSSCN